MNDDIEIHTQINIPNDGSDVRTDMMLVIGDVKILIELGSLQYCTETR